MIETPTLAEKVAKMRTEVHSFIKNFKQFSANAMRIVTCENNIQEKSSEVLAFSMKKLIESDSVDLVDLMADTKKGRQVIVLIEVADFHNQQLEMMTSDVAAVFDRYDKFVDFASKVSAKVDKTRLDEFSDATVLNNKLEVVKKKIEGFDVQIEKDYKTIMGQTYALFIRLLQEYSDFFNRH